MLNSFLMLLMPSMTAVPAQVASDDLPQVALSQHQRQNLITSLASSTVNTRIHAISTLGIERVRESVPHLIQLLKDDNPHVRAEAATALGTLKVKNAGPRLYQIMLHDSSPLVRARATVALADLDYTGAITAISMNLDRPDIRERMAAVRALGKFGGPKAFNHLIRLLRSGTPELRETVIEALGDLGDRQVVRYLFRYLEQGSTRLNRAALLALTRLHPQMVQSRLPQLLRRTEPELVIAALDSAAQIGCPDCASQILQLIETAEDPIASQAASTAAYLQMREAVEPILIRLQPRPNLQSRILYLWSLGRLGSMSVLPETLHALSDPLPELRLTALRILRILRPEKLNLEEIIVPMLQDNNPSVAAEAILLLGEYGHRSWLGDRLPGEATSTLRLSAAITSLAWVHPLPAHLLGNLRTWSRNEDTRIRNAAIATLGRFRDVASLDALLKSVYSSDDRLRWEAVRALALLRSSEARSTLAAIATQDPLRVVRAYALLGIRVLDPEAKSFEVMARTRFEERFEERDYAEAYVYALALAQNGRRENLDAFQKVFNVLLKSGSNSSQKTEFVDLLFLFGEQWGAPWMEEALSSPLTRVRSRAMVWKARYSQPDVALPASVQADAALPVSMKDRSVRLPFAKENPRSGCGCRTGQTDSDPRILWIAMAAWLLRPRRRRRA
ncbi:HEAT repeat domain-containing protein [Myxococcota bacterium]|nr:HEAT repeat domain-containing protein [Myxococcota bacterium]